MLSWCHKDGATPHRVTILGTVLHPLEAVRINEKTTLPLPPPPPPPHSLCPFFLSCQSASLILFSLSMNKNKNCFFLLSFFFPVLRFHGLLESRTVREVKDLRSHFWLCRLCFYIVLCRYAGSRRSKTDKTRGQKPRWETD